MTVTEFEPGAPWASENFLSEDSLNTGIMCQDK